MNRLNELNREQQEQIQELVDIMATSNTEDLVILHLIGCVRTLSAHNHAQDIHIQALTAQNVQFQGQFQTMNTQIQTLQQNMAKFVQNRVESNFSKNHTFSS